MAQADVRIQKLYNYMTNFLKAFQMVTLHVEDLLQVNNLKLDKAILVYLVQVATYKSAAGEAIAMYFIT